MCVDAGWGWRGWRMVSAMTSSFPPCGRKRERVQTSFTVLLTYSPAVNTLFITLLALALKSSFNIVPLVTREPCLEFHDNLTLNSKTGVENLKIIAVHGPPVNQVVISRDRPCLRTRVVPLN
ncbi:hypothetical protein Q8A67_006000 [Cirrhinus molitorella]|uniref:Uncharacterized protein n=1 Tax=Cirrhinus molitorella TaxID=172907 RepID=A0AA88TVX2_9TELE|nr:hypothetical protein Q8A67_006000 [Cirrhinus molitorella]